MNTHPFFNHASLAISLYEATIMEDAFRFLRKGNIVRTAGSRAGNTVSHHIAGSLLPRPVSLEITPTPATGNRLYLVTGLPAVVSLEIPDTTVCLMPCIMDLTLLRHFTYVMVLADNLEAVSYLGNHLRRRHQFRSEDNLIEILEALRNIGTVVLIDANPAAAVRTWTFADTTAFRANKLVMERFRPMLRQLAAV